MYKSELQETKVESLPIASLETLKNLRNEMCSNKFSKLQSHQKFLRRILSPDSPTRSLLMVHGTGTGKTCSAIQIAEEYIIRPEFQYSKVLVIANPPVQENFRKQIFNTNNIYEDDDGLLLSKQCTGRRYLDMLQRIQKEPLKWSSPLVRQRMSNISKKIIDEFYEFQGYIEFANKLENEEQFNNNSEHIKNWIHKTYDNRIIIIDEAHNIKYSDETSMDISKKISRALEIIIKTAHNITLILLTATPMYDTYDEIIYYLNLFLWNDKKQDSNSSLQVSKIFDLDGNFKEGMETKFRGWCEDYISFIKGDNPLTFPFRLPPPNSLIAQISTKDIFNKHILKKDRRSILTLCHSFLKGYQKEIVPLLKPMGAQIQSQIICTLPSNKQYLSNIFNISSNNEDGTYEYKSTPYFLAPSQVSNYSSKFALILSLIEKSDGIIFVYSSLKELGCKLFSMCLEEHGYSNAMGKTLMKKTSEEIPKGSKGKYILLTPELTELDQKKAIDMLIRKENSNGQQVKILVGSKFIAEGIDLKNIRQIHILDYWWNMSRIEQVVGRGIRTCSHQLLPFEKQNCTIYLHISKLEDNQSQELIDEYYYRTKIEFKAKKVAFIKNIIMESAMDCPLQQDINRLPKLWRELPIPQQRSQDQIELSLSLHQLASPVFGEESDLVCKNNLKEPDPDHERPLSSYIDIRDELLDIFLDLFYKKPIWLKSDLLNNKKLKSYDPNVVIYTLQNAIESGFIIKNKQGKKGHIISRKNYYSFSLTDKDVVQDLYTDPYEDNPIDLTKIEIPKTTSKNLSIQNLLDSKKSELSSFLKDNFSKDVLDWYILDHALTKEERLEYMLNLDWTNPPLYAKPLKLQNNILVLGSQQFYKDNKKITLIGDDFDLYTQWVIELKQKFLSTRKLIFATMKDSKILFNLDPDSDKIEPVSRSKVIGGRACTNYSESLLKSFSEFLTSNPFPDNVKTIIQRCQYLSLVIRNAILNKKEGIIWYTPEEYEILYEDSNRKDLLLKLKQL